MSWTYSAMVLHENVSAFYWFNLFHISMSGWEWWQYTLANSDYCYWSFGQIPGLKPPDLGLAESAVVVAKEASAAGGIAQSRESEFAEQILAWWRGEAQSRDWADEMMIEGLQKMTDAVVRSSHDHGACHQSYQK